MGKYKNYQNYKKNRKYQKYEIDEELKIARCTLVTSVMS